jgi:phage tail tape-measure protein
MVAAAAGFVAVDSLVSGFMETNVEAGRLRASLETVTGSARAASDAWNELSAFAAQTPYDLAQSVEGFIKLKALGLEPTIDALKSYGNTASSMGKDLMQMIEAVADAATGEFERLKEFGIKASAEGESVSLTFQGVTTTIRNDAKEIEKYLQTIGNVQFAGAMERQAQTIGGALSSLKGSVSGFWLAIGDRGASEAARTASIRVTLPGYQTGRCGARS